MAMDINDFTISEFSAPQNPGVYAVWASNYPFESGIRHLLYIGSAQNMWSRIHNNTHPYMMAYKRLNGSVFISFYITPDYVELERDLIKKYRPILNIKGKK